MTRRPHNATAWCALHEKYMNDRRWLFISGSEEGRHDSCRE